MTKKYYVGIFQSVILPGLLTLALTAWAGTETAHPTTPRGEVPKDWWAAVQKNMTQSEYNITWQDEATLPGLGAAWQAPNRAHDLRVYFTDEGPRVVRRTAGAGEWVWGLELIGVGGTTDCAAPSQVRDACVEGTRIAFERDGLSEWYLNGPAGLEQGFTVNESPAEDGLMVVRMGVRGDVSANMTPDGQTVEFLSPGGVVVMHYGKLVVTDAAGRTLPSAMSVTGAGDLELLTDTRGAAFPVTIDPLATSAAWMAESNQAGAKYGWSVATAGDVNGDGFSDIVIGTPLYDGGLADEGVVSVFHGSATGLPIAASWTVEGNQAGANFGWSVGTAGDVNGDGFSDILIGAPLYDGGLTDEGAVFVHHGSAAGLSPTANWTSEGDQAAARFGWSVATAGDVNNDGRSDVIIGAPRFAFKKTDEGRAFVFLGTATGLGTAADWKIDGGQVGAAYGTSVSMAGDVNCDGYGDIVVGAPGFDDSTSDEGLVELYYGSSTGVLLTPAWSVTGPSDGDGFGLCVSGAGDVNGDNYADVILGVPHSGGSGQGKVLVYRGSATGLSASADWTQQGSMVDQWLGSSVSAAGDVNGDGYADVIIGASQDERGQSYEGRAYVHFGSPTGLGPLPMWTGEPDQANAHYGVSVAAAGDINGDGFADVVVSAPDYDNGQSDEGRVFVYLGSASGMSVSWKWSGQGGQAQANFGASVSSAGDVNGDGFGDVIIGANSYDSGQTDEGRVFVYHGAAAGLSSTADWVMDGDQQNAGFGYSVSAAGDVNGDGYGDVIIGAPLGGRAVVYHGSATGLLIMPSWSSEGDQASAAFGYSVSGAGDVNGDGYGDVVVGATAHDNGQNNEGRLFVYHGSASGLNLSADWTAESNNADSFLGSCVSSAGDVNGDGYADLIAGAAYFTNGELNEGAAFVYHGSALGLSAAPVWSVESGQASAYLGHSVSAAGDVNGDGFGDVVCGAFDYDSGYAHEGRVFVHYGSASGLSPVADWTADGGQANASFGDAVASAGDVNGDGYGDLAVGAYTYSDGETAEGRVFIWHGSGLGLPATADRTVESNQAQARFGAAVSSAGDVNGDGYGDLIVGAFGMDAGETDEGMAFLYYGNGDGGDRGLSLNPRQRRGDDTAPLPRMGLSSGSDVRLAVKGRSPFGRGKMKLECEVKPFGTPFNGTGTVKTTSWTSTGLGGAPLNQLVSGLPSGVHHWRVRLLYSPATTPLQQKSRWFTVPLGGWEEGCFRVTAPPITGSIFINNNRSATNNPAVTLALTWGGGSGTGVVRMRFSNDGSNWTAWEPLSASKPYTLPAGDAHKTVRVQYLDDDNNRSAIYSDYIRLDTIKPTGTIIINGGAVTTTSRNVTLNLTWADGAGAQVSRMRFSDNGSTWTPWMPPTATRAHTLPLATLGYQTVRVQYLDGAGNYSAVYNDYIKLVAP